MKIIYSAFFDLYASILKNGEYVCVEISHILWRPVWCNHMENMINST